MTHKQQMNAAMGLLRNGATDQALALAGDLAKLAPGNAEVRQLLALCLTRAGDAAGAEREFRQALQLAPGHPGVLANLATLLRGGGRSLEALPLLRRAIDADPGFVQGWMDLGVTELSLGHHDQAAHAFEKAIGLQPSSRAWHYLGNARRAAGDLAQSETAFRHAVALDPDAATAWINLGAVLRLQGRAEEAVACYERAEFLGYRGAELRDALVGALTDAGRVAEALAHARRLVAEQPTFAPGHRTFAGLLWEYGSSLQAPQDPFATFKAAADAQPENLQLQQGHVAFLIEAGKTQEASDRLEDLRRRQDAPLLIRMHADALARSGQPKRADQLYAALYRDGDRSVGFLNAYARHLLVCGRWKEASDCVMQALQRDPLNQQALANQATAWRLLGDDREFWLCDYQRLINVIDVEPPADFSSRDEFLDALNATLDTLHLATREPVAQSLRSGSQTPGQLFGRPDALIESTRQAMQRAVDRVLAELPVDALHPFLHRNTCGARFSGSWSVKLWKSGRHVNHIHSEGWISSAFYVKLPPSVRAATSATRAGWIQFGQPPLDMDLQLEPRRVVRPEPGQLVLFPSYLWHGTVPFEDPEPRVTVAFDVVPVTRTQPAAGTRGGHAF